MLYQSELKSGDASIRMESSKQDDYPQMSSRQRLSIVLGLVLIISVSVSFRIGASEFRHPLNSYGRRRLSDRKIRYLTLGGPSTWGLGLEDPESTGYAWKLSPSVHNAAQIAGGPTLASLCTQSIVGENIYDVVVLEFSPVDEFTSLSLLAHRLRQRFPRAVLLFVEIWSPKTLAYTKDERVDLFSSSRTNQSASSLDSLEYEIALERLSHLVDQVGGVRVRGLPQPSNAKDAVLKVKDLFVKIQKDRHDKDDTIIQYTLSQSGHTLVANALKSKIDTLSILETPIEKRNEVGTWASGDMCNLWYETGAIDNSLSYTGFWLKRFSKTAENKYALELSPNGGSITMSNPFKEDRIVFLTYMTASELSYSNKVYPSAKVKVGDKNSVIINPLHNDNGILHHISRTTAIGKIPPGQTTLHFDPIERTVSPFRIIGVSILADEKFDLGIPTEFLLSPEGAHVEDLHTYLDLL